MNELVKIHDHKGQKVVSARELHYYLESKRDFSTWIKDRIEKFEFVENVDFVTFTKIVERAKRIEYAITIDMAKELSMVENNDKGKTARRYFIECEKKLRQSTPSIPQSFAEALELAAHQAREIEEKERAIKQLAPKADFAERVIDTETRVDIGQAAKLLKLPFGRNTFFRALRECGIFFKNRNEPKQEFIERGYFELFMVVIPTENHGDISASKIIVTQKGLLWLAKQFNTSYNPGLPNLNSI